MSLAHFLRQGLGLVDLLLGELQFFLNALVFEQVKPARAPAAAASLSQGRGRQQGRQTDRQ